MIISAKRQRLASKGVKLADWCAAPLGLHIGARYWLVVDDTVAEPGAPRPYEAIITTFPFETWKDLWRVEIDTDDEPGTLALITELMHRHKLSVLFSEGSVNTFGEHHSMTFVVDAHDYRNLTDGSTIERYEAAYCELKEFALEFKLNAVDLLTLGGSRNLKFNVRRLGVHRRLYKDVTVGRRRLLMQPDGNVLSKSGVVLNPKIRTAIHAHVGETPFYSASIDTKNRIVRLLFFSADNPYGYLQICAPTHAVTECLAHIAALASNCDCNIVRYQVRPGLNETAAARLNGEQRLAGYSRVDISMVNHTSDMPNLVVQERLIRLIERDQRLSELGVFISAFIDDDGGRIAAPDTVNA